MKSVKYTAEWILIVVATTALGQPNPDTLWTRTYGGGWDDLAYSVQQTTDGGYVAAGYSESFGAGGWNFYVVKTDAQGDTLWTRTYGGGGNDFANSIQQTTDGGYVVAGVTNYAGGNSSFYVVKLDTQGDTLWTRTYGGGGVENATSIQQTTDDGYVIAGYSTSFSGAWNANFYVVKTDAQGDTLWTHTYGDSSNVLAYSVQQTTDGGFVIAGNTDPFAPGNDDFYVVKTDAQGDTLWTRTYGGNADEMAYSVQQTTDGGYVVAGSSESFGEGDEDFYVVKTDGQGDTLWTRTYGGVIAYSIQQTTGGGYVVAGYAYNGTTIFFVVKTDEQGDTLWTNTYGGDGFEVAHSIQQTADGGYVVAGSTSSFGAGAVDVWLIKIESDYTPLRLSSPNGGEQWPLFSLQTVTWASDSVDGLIRIELNRDYPTGTWEILADNTPDDNQEEIFVTSGTSQSCRVRISLIGDTLSDESNGNFSITNPLYVTFPDSGEVWPLFSTQNVTWNSDYLNGTMRIELNRNYPNGTWEILADNTPDDNQEDVTVSGSFSNACRVRISLIGDTISDESNGNFSITNPLYITFPNGGEAWPLFSTQNVTWSSDNLNGTMRIELNRNYPNGTWEILTDNTPDDNQEEIFVTSGTSQNCRVRIHLVGDTLSDISDENFSITTSAGTLRLVYPQLPDNPINFWYAGELVEQDTFSETFRLKNFGNEPIVFVTVLEPASDEFSVSCTCDTIELAPSEMSTCELSLFFHPQENGVHQDTLLILTNASNQQNGYVRIPLEGELNLGAEETTTLPTEFALSSYPNPFNAETTIGFSLPRSAQVELNVFDVQGRLVNGLARQTYSAGTHSVHWNAVENATGIYFVRLSSAEFSMTQKVVLLK